MLKKKNTNRERHSESDIEKGRAGYRAAKRRKVSLETDRQTDTGHGEWNRNRGNESV